MILNSPAPIGSCFNVMRVILCSEPLIARTLKNLTQSRNYGGRKILPVRKEVEDEMVSKVFAFGIQSVDEAENRFRDASVPVMGRTTILKRKP